MQTSCKSCVSISLCERYSECAFSKKHFRINYIFITVAREINFYDLSHPEVLTLTIACTRVCVIFL